jgi:mannosyltransferase
VSVEAPARGAHADPPAARTRIPWAALAVAAVLVVTTVLRFWTTSQLWLDEALSVNIARLPLSQLHSALRQDGAPPLYYVLLHFWIQVFGIGNLAVRSLSGVISVATLPLAWFAGRRLGGKRLAWLALLVVAANPYAITYATSARMYALIVLLVFAGYLVTLRALERPNLGRLALVALVTALLSYTQYWCFYLLAVAGALLVIRALRAGPGDTRRSTTRVIAAVVVGGLTFIPWLPTFVYQARHTGTPWGNARVPWSAIAETVLRFAGSPQNAETYILLFALATLVVFGVLGRGRDDHTIELDLRTQPTIRWEAMLGAGTLVLGTTVAFVSGSAVDPRYASVMFPFYALLAAVGITCFTSTRVRVGVLVVVVGLGIIGGVRNYTTSRTQAAQVADVIAADAHPGDVVAYCPDQLGPSGSRLLRDVPGLVQLTFPDGASPARVDWVDYVHRNQTASTQRFANRVLRLAGPHTVWFVYAYGFNHLQGRCEAVASALGAARPAEPRVLPNESIDQFGSEYEYMGLTAYRP